MANDVVIDVKTKGTKKAKSAFGELTKGAAKLGLAFGAIKVAQFGLDAVGAFSDLEESINAVTVIYGEQDDVIARLGETSAEAFGLTTTEVNEAAVAMGAFVEKIDEADPADAFGNIIQRATDFASVMNIDTAEALDKFQSGLAGQSRPLKEFGLDISAAATEQVALAVGIIETGETMTEAEKVQARYLTIMQQTEGTVGDFRNTADGLANSQKILTAKWKEAQTELGKKLAPLMLQLGEIATDLIPLFGQVVDVIGELVASILPLVGVLADAARLLGEYEESVAAATSTETLGKDVGLLEFNIRGLASALTGIPIKIGETAIAADAAKVKFEGLAQRAKDVANNTGKFAVNLKKVKTEATAARIKIRDLTASVGNLGDPVATAIEASAKLAETLKRIQEDGEVTGGELLELRGAINELQEAEEAVDATEILAFGSEIRGDLALLDEKTKVSAGFLEQLPFTAVNAFAQTETAFLELIKTPMTVRVQASLPSPSAFDRLLRTAIEQARRRGDFGGGFQP